MSQAEGRDSKKKQRESETDNKKSQKKCLIKEEKKAQKFFEENQNYFKYPGYQCHLRHERPSTLLCVTLASIKTIKLEINRYNQLQDLGLQPVLLSISMSPSTTMFSWRYFQASFLTALSINSWHHTLFPDYFLLLKFIQAFYTYMAIYTKGDLSIVDNGFFDGFFKLLLWQGIK